VSIHNDHPDSVGSGGGTRSSTRRSFLRAGALGAASAIYTVPLLTAAANAAPAAIPDQLESLDLKVLAGITMVVLGQYGSEWDPELGDSTARAAADVVALLPAEGRSRTKALLRRIAAGRDGKDFMEMSDSERRQLLGEMGRRDYDTAALSEDNFAAGCGISLVRATFVSPDAYSAWSQGPVL
jgi:hypothetical protein